MKVGITELDIAFENKEETKIRCEEIFAEAAEEEVDFLVFPEMTLAGFTMNPEKCCEGYKDGKIPESISFFMKNSKRYKMAIAFGFIERFEEKNSDGEVEIFYENKLAMVDGGNLLMDYSKIHPFSFSGEDKVYRAGREICVSEIRDNKMAGYICYDLRFPEIFSGIRDKYDTAVVIANWPEARVAHFETLLRARAIENQAYVIGVNRIGEGGGLSYVASSHVFDYLGNDIAKRVSEKLLIAEIDREKVLEARRVFPQRSDRKKDFYSRFYK